jgi:arginyl-tRNA synthetase
VIPGDIGRELGLRASGTWRQALPGTAAAPGTYATSLPFGLAAETGREAAEVAAELAARLRPVAWIAAASATGGGYLTVTVTPAALAALAVRVPEAGDACVSSDALSGTSLEEPPAADTRSAEDWPGAWRLVTAAVTGRLAAAAGATVKERATARPSAPSSALAAADTEAVRYALARRSSAPAGPFESWLCVRSTLDNPWFMVRYAHSSAASVLRWACDLGIDRGWPEDFRPDLLAARTERDLLGAISWLPERAAAAARRRRPAAFVRHLESLAGAWLSCSESCPALPFGGRSAPRDESGMAARLWLAAAAQTSLAAGLRLAGVVPPLRL